MNTRGFPSRGPWPQHNYTDGIFLVNFLLLTGLLGLLVSGLAGCPLSREVLAHCHGSQTLPKTFSRPLGAQFNPIKTRRKAIELKTYSLGAVGSSSPKVFHSTTAPATEAKPFPTKFRLLLTSLYSFPCAPETQTMLAGWGPWTWWDFPTQLQRNWEWLCLCKIQCLTASMSFYWYNHTTAAKPLCYISWSYSGISAHTDIFILTLHKPLPRKWKIKVLGRKGAERGGVLNQNKTLTSEFVSL